jgi:lysophospholipid acyltransferase
MDAVFLPLADALGASVDQIKVKYQALYQIHIVELTFLRPQLISCLLIAYPLGPLFVRVPSSKPALRHLFSVIVAIVFFFPVLRLYSAFFQLLASILATYVVTNFHKGKSMPWVVFAYVASYIRAGNYIYNMIFRIVMGHLTVK